MTDAKPFPLDFERLERGDIIPSTTIEGWKGSTPDTNDFRLDQMRLAQMIREHFLEMRGDVLSIRTVGNTLHLLTHQQQNEYVPRAQRQALRVFARRHAEDQGIDPSQLSPEQQQRRDDRLRKSSWLIQQFRRRASTIPQPEIAPQVESGAIEE